MEALNAEQVLKVLLEFVELANLRRHKLPTIRGTEDKAPDYSVVRGDEILKMDGDNLPNLVDPIFPRSGLAGFGGSSDTGKSTFLKQLATAIARDEGEFLGFPLNVRHKSVIYVSTEDDIHAVKTVMKRQRRKGTRSSTMSGLRFLFNSENTYYQVASELKKEPADLVIIDAFSDITTGDLNKGDVVRPFLEKFSNLSKEHECLIIFLHHTTKKAEGGIPKKGNLLGSQGFEAKCRLVFLLVKDPGEDHIRHLCIVKGNYLSDEFKSMSYVMEFDSDSLTFNYTGEKAHFEDLSTADGNRRKETTELKRRALDLRHTGLTQGQIAHEVGRDKSQISRWFKEADRELQSKESNDDENLKLSSMLETFIATNPKYKNLEDLRKKYGYAKVQDKTKIRNQFSKHAKLENKVTHEKFQELLGD